MNFHLATMNNTRWMQDIGGNEFDLATMNRRWIHHIVGSLFKRTCLSESNEKSREPQATEMTQKHVSQTSWSSPTGISHRLNCESAASIAGMSLYAVRVQKKHHKAAGQFRPMRLRYTQQKTRQRKERRRHLECFPERVFAVQLCRKLEGFFEESGFFWRLLLGSYTHIFPKCGAALLTDLKIWKL